ncbi:TPA: hypothetical protein EYO57_34495 [Candidatus Poribacteria bacterium]|nr:hypothetical protein [Candidatus Poribacteria bacterium]
MSMHKQSCSILTVFLLTAVVTAEITLSPKITPQLLSETSTGRNQKVWIHFTNKDHFKEEELENAISRCQQSMPARVKYRRLIRAERWQADFTDLPVHSAYIDQVLQIGGHLRSRSRWLNAIGLEANLQQIMQIEKLPFVRSITPILTYTTELYTRTESQIPTVPPANQFYGDSDTQITQVQADFLHQKGFFGAEIVIGLLDTGFSLKHTAIAHVNVIDQYDFVNNDNDTSDQFNQDDPKQDEHGSIVLGILAGKAPEQLIGLAHQASFLLAKTEKISENGQEFERVIEEDWCIEGIEWLEGKGVDLINCSLGYSDWYNFRDLDGQTSKLTIAADLATEKGVLMVVAAGNQGTKLGERITVPADGFKVLAIGAVNRNQSISWFSAKGPTYDGRIKPDFVALGEQVTSIIPDTRSGFSSTNRGTSLSCAVAAGAISLLLQAFPKATTDQITNALRATAVNANDPNNSYGYGLIRAKSAFEVLLDQFGHTGNMPDPISIKPLANLKPITWGKLKPSFELLQNFPNPFNAETWIPFRLGTDGEMKLSIYSSSGSLIQTVDVGHLEPGNYTSRQRAIYWNGQNYRREDVVSGVYFCVLQVLGESAQTSQLILLK